MPWEWLEAVHDPALIERIRTGGLSVREERGLGLPWSEALVERGRRSVGGTVAAAGLALEHGLGMNLGGGTHHAGPRLRARLLPVQRRRRGARPHARRGPRAARAGSRLRRPPGRRHRRPARRRPGRASRCRCTAPATIRSSASPPTSTSTSRAAPGDDAYLTALAQALDHAIPRGGRRAGLLPGGRRSVARRPARAAGADQGGPAARATSWCSIACARRAPRSAWCSPAATRRTCATRSTSTPRLSAL